MARESTGNDVLDKLYKKHDKLENEIIRLSQELGWCDKNGNFEPLEKDFIGMSSELERKRIESRDDTEKEVKVGKMSIQLNRISRKIKEIEKNKEMINT